MSNGLPRCSALTTFIGAVLIALFMVSCAARPENQGFIDQLQGSIQEAAENADSEEIYERSIRMIGLKPMPVQRVWALGHALKSGRTLKKYSEFQSLIEQTHAALTALNDDIPYKETYRESPARKAYLQAEEGLREVNEHMFNRWDMGKGDTTDTVVKSFSRSGEVYREFFDEAILYSSVVYRDAEYLFATGENMKAAALYEDVIVKDFEGTYATKARGRIAEIWVAESNATPFPTDVAAPTEIPSPHKEWLDISNRQIKSKISDEEKRAILLRQGQLQLAFGHIDKGYAIYEDLAKGSQSDDAAEALDRLLDHTLNKNKIEAFNIAYAKHTPEKAGFLWSHEAFRKKLLATAHNLMKHDPVYKDEGYRMFDHLAHSKKDETAVDAAIAYMEYAAKHEAKSKSSFRKVRKSLQENKFLWSKPRFRVVVFKLKEEIEGTK